MTSVKELEKYLDDPSNGLKKEWQSGDVQVKLTYLPLELLEARSGQKDFIADSLKLCFFQLSFSKSGKELLRQLDFDNYSEMLQIFAFRMSSFISLRKDKSAPLKPEDCVFQQTFGMTSANTVLVAFDASETQAKENIEIQINEFGLGLGILTFHFDPKDIKNIPEIKFNDK